TRRYRAVNVRVFLAARFRGLVGDRHAETVAVDDQHDEVVGVAVDVLGYGAQLLRQGTMDEALLVQGDAAGRHAVPTRAEGGLPGRPVGDVEQTCHCQDGTSENFVPAGHRRLAGTVLVM